MNEGDNRRRTITISLSAEVREALNGVLESLRFEDGKSYPRSYLIEDMIWWILEDEDRFTQFIEDNYIVEERSDEEED